MRFFLKAAFVVLVSAASAKAKADTIPAYKNPKLAIDLRIQDLLGRMTTEEKIGQLQTLLGWHMYTRTGNSVTVSETFKESLQHLPTGMLWGTFRADPWTQKTLTNGLSPELAAQCANALQKYTIEHTRLGIPIMLVEEAPHGHMAIGTTVFPTGLGQASTWDTALLSKMAATVAAEVRLQGAHAGYGPILDLGREPRWSRLEETFGEDPVLVGAMGEAVVKGLQGNNLQSGRNIISTLKHFTAYGVPEGGHNGGSVAIGNRELFQSYLPPFKQAVAAGAQSVMVAYNSIDGIPCSANSYLLDSVLRKQWGFQGYVVSDLGSISGIKAQHGVAASGEDASMMAIDAGVDSDLGGYGFGDSLLQAVKDEKVTEQTLDTAVARVLRAKFEMGLFEHPYVEPAAAKKEVRSANNIALAAQVARESIILLKNENNTLPLSKTLKNVLVVGPNADNMYNQLGDYTAPQDSANIITVLEGLKSKLPSSVKVNYIKGCAIRDTTNTQIPQAVAAAKNADVAIVVLGGSSARDFKTSYEKSGAAKVSDDAVSDMESGEGFDRASLTLLGKQMELLEKITATGTPVVLVLIEGRPLELNWASTHVNAIVNAWYPGGEGGNAIADVLLGNYNPAGRLPVSVPRSAGQLPVYYNYKKPSPHNYVEMSSQPLYPFGYGLSYSTFTYTNLAISSGSTTDDTVATVQFTIKNTGSRAGDEVAQLYIRDEVSSVVTPVKQLKKFARINLQPGEEKTLSFKLTKADLQLFNRNNEWVAEPGSFTIMVGASSEDIRLKDSFVLK